MRGKTDQKEMRLDNQRMMMYRRVEQDIFNETMSELSLINCKYNLFKTVEVQVEVAPQDFFILVFTNCFITKS